MASPKSGKCTNYSGCKLAYRNEEITVVTKEFRCPECGSPLESLGYVQNVSGIRLLSIGVAAVLLLAVAAIIWTFFFGLKPSQRIRVVEATPTMTPTPTPTPMPAENPVVRIEPIATSTPTIAPVPTATPSPAAISLDLEITDVDEVREAARQRIFRIPNVSDGTREWLLQAVDRAHAVGRLFSVTFDTSSAKLTAEDIAFIKSQVANTRIEGLLNKPALALFVLGFADRQGNDDQNLGLSKERAQVVTDVLRNQCGVQTVIQVVPMGGTNIHDSHDYTKNRVVEVWATLP